MAAQARQSNAPLPAAVALWRVIVRPHPGIDGMWDVYERNRFYGNWECVAAYGDLDQAIGCAKELR